VAIALNATLELTVNPGQVRFPQGRWVSEEIAMVLERFA
jgi:hypothetical protein